MHAIAVDAMGGDHAPTPEVDGALAAIREREVKVILCGDEARLRALLRERGASESDRLTVQHAAQVVTMDDHAGKAFRQKRNSSLRVAFELVKDGAAQAVVSAGNSGAVLSHAVFVLRRLPEVDRPAIVTVFPTPTGTLTLCDMGANVDVKPAVLAQFGVLGALYDRLVHQHARPRVGLLSNGSEDHKGTELTREALLLLRAAAASPAADFEFVGYVEGTDLFAGGIDVVATDGFTGNVVLKTCEGVSQAVMRMVKARLLASARGRLGGLLVRAPLRQFVQEISASETGGALLVGVGGIVIIAHGGSDATAIKNAIRAADRFVDLGLVGHLGRAIGQLSAVWDGAAGPAAAAAIQDELSLIRARISGTGRALPARIVTNEELSRTLPTSDQWIRERTGIVERRLLGPGEVTSDLCARAGLNALAAAGLGPREIDLIIVATVTPDMMMPSCAAITQHKMAAACPAFDLGAACAGFSYGLSVADGLVRSGQYRRILLIGAEALSRFIDWDDRATAILFGDGAGAVVIEGADDDRPMTDPAAPGILATYLAADGGGAPSLNIPGGGTQHPPSADSLRQRQHFLRMDGRAIFAVAVRAMSDACERVLAAAAFPADQVDFILPHQANLRIIDAIVHRLALDRRRVLVNLDRYGNTSSASIPIALDEAVRDGRIVPGATILSCGMGAGLTWGAALLRW